MPGIRRQLSTWPLTHSHVGTIARSRDPRYSVNDERVCSARARGPLLARHELVTLLVAANEAQPILQFRHHLHMLHRLILDKRGYVATSRPAAELRFDVLATAYLCNRLIVTINLSFENWTARERSPHWCSMDCLIHHFHILETTGKATHFRIRSTRTTNRSNAAPPLLTRDLFAKAWRHQIRPPAPPLSTAAYNGENRGRLARYGVPSKRCSACHLTICSDLCLWIPMS